MKIEQKFINLLLENKVLLFGDFTLKSGKKSNFFLNFGKMNTGKSLAELSNILAETIKENLDNGKLEKFDVIFGTAYKGISIASSVCDALWRNYQISVKFAYDCKEENNIFESHELEGQNILMIDDVLVAGTAFFATKELLSKNIKNYKLVGLLVGVDRQEGGTQKLLELESSGIKLFSVINRTHLLNSKLI